MKTHEMQVTPCPSVNSPAGTTRKSKSETLNSLKTKRKSESENNSIGSRRKSEKQTKHSADSNAEQNFNRTGGDELKQKI